MGKEVNVYDRLIIQNEEQQKELKEKAEEYKEQIEIAKKQESLFMHKMNSLKREWGVRFWHQMNGEQKTIFAGLKSDFYGARMTSTSLGNRLFSTYHSLFDLALDKGDYINQQSLFS